MTLITQRNTGAKFAVHAAEGNSWGHARSFSAGDGVQQHLPINDSNGPAGVIHNHETLALLGEH